MDIEATPQGPKLSGDLEKNPLPLLLGLCAINRATGQMVVDFGSERCQIGLLNGSIVGLQWSDEPLEATGPGDKDMVSALVKQAIRLFINTSGQFSFQSSANPSPSMIPADQLPTLFMVRYGLARSSDETLLNRLFQAAFHHSPIITVPASPSLDILGRSAKKQLLDYGSPTRVYPDTLSKTERQLLVTVWCHDMVEFDPPSEAEEQRGFLQKEMFASREMGEVSEFEPILQHEPEIIANIKPATPVSFTENTKTTQKLPKEWEVERKAPTLSEDQKQALEGLDAIVQLFQHMDEWNASDLFLCETRPPALRVHGKVVTLDIAPNTREQFESFFTQALPSRARKRYDETGDLDIGYSIDEKRRFRLNLHKQTGKMALVARAIPLGNLTFQELGLPESLTHFAKIHRGLVLVTGATSSGKSTTLAALINHINQNRQAHIVTIEEPIEFIHHDQKSRITQREVGSDTESFHAALRHVVRESPDVILIGEMRDHETMSVAISAALTGHLVLASLHTINATQTLQRIMSYYPEHLREQVAMDLSLSLQGILSQRLVPKKDGKGRALAVEMLSCTPAATQLLRQQRMEEMEDLLKSSTDPGLISFNRSLLSLYRRGQISFEVGKAYATNPDEFSLSAQGMETGVRAFQGGHDADPTGELDMKTLLHLVLKRGASDLHLTTGRPPILRINGSLEPLPYLPLSEADMRLLLYSILTVRQRSEYQLNRELDFALSLENGQRFRVNAYYQKGNMATSLRSIPTKIPDPSTMEIPKQVMKLADQPHGLLLVVGPTGSGKSTTLACMIDRVNQTRPCRIITVEDPIEFTHESALATVDQREVNADTKGFSNALKYVLRQDPDVILIGEMRDLETISAAMTAAETGHLVLATLHTNDAIQTIDRIIDAYPAHQQPQIRSQLSTCLLGVVSQRLMRRKSNDGRIAAFEIMVATPAIRHLIREGKMHQAKSTLEVSKKHGMVTMDDALKDLFQRGKISLESALRFVHNPQILQAAAQAQAQANQTPQRGNIPPKMRK